MSSPIDLKRHDDTGIHSSKRIKVEEFSILPEILQTDLISIHVLSFLPVPSIHMFASVSKRTQYLTQFALRDRAHEIGLKAENSQVAINKLKQIWKFAFTLGKKQIVILSPQEDLIRTMTNLNFKQMLRSTFELHLNLFQSVNVVVELLEVESTWKKAREYRQLTQEEQKLAYFVVSCAVISKQLKFVQLLLEDRLVDLNQPPRVFLPRVSDKIILPTPLELAVLKGDLETVKFLLAKGATMKSESRERVIHAGERRVLSVNWNILRYALGSSIRNYFPDAQLNVPMLEFLLDNGAEITSEVMLDAANTASFELFNFFMQRGAKFAEDDATGYLMKLVLAKIEIQDFKIDDSFRQLGLLFMSKDAQASSTVLVVACQYDNLEIVRFLVENGADLSTVSQEESLMTPLMMATLKGNLEIVAYLLESGADVNQRVEIEDEDDEGSYYTALTHTCFTDDDDWELHDPRSNDPELVKLLLEYGAEPVLPDSIPQSPLHMAKAKGLTQIVAVLEEHMARVI